jgi:hypothetical protein
MGTPSPAKAARASDSDAEDVVAARPCDQEPRRQPKPVDEEARAPAVDDSDGEGGDRHGDQTRLSPSAVSDGARRATKARSPGVARAQEELALLGNDAAARLDDDDDDDDDFDDDVGKDVQTSDIVLGRSSRKRTDHKKSAENDNCEDDNDEDEDDDVWKVEAKKGAKKSPGKLGKKPAAKKIQSPKPSLMKNKALSGKNSSGSKKSPPSGTNKTSLAAKKKKELAADKKLIRKTSAKKQSSDVQDVHNEESSEENEPGIARNRSVSKDKALVSKKPPSKLLLGGKQKAKAAKHDDDQDEDKDAGMLGSSTKLGKALFHTTPKLNKKKIETLKNISGGKGKAMPISAQKSKQYKPTSKPALLNVSKTSKMVARKHQKADEASLTGKQSKRKRDDKSVSSAKKQKKLAETDSENEDEISPARTTLEQDEEEENDSDGSEDDDILPIPKRPYLGGIACSSADSTTRDLLDAAVKGLGGYCAASPEDAVLFIAGKVRRGPALLTAISRGIPVLHQGFLTSAITEGKWPSNWAPFEEHAGAKQSRLTKENPRAVGFLKDKRIKLSGALAIDSASLSLMIRESGGRVVSTREDIVLSDHASSAGSNNVTLKWFADSIEEQRILPFDSYRIAV